MKFLVIFCLVAATTAVPFFDVWLRLRNFKVSDGKTITFESKVAVKTISTQEESPSNLNDWRVYKTKFGKNYNWSEEKSRLEIFKTNLRKIQEHNERYQRNEVSYEVGINQFTDMTHTEFLETLNEFDIEAANDELKKLNKNSFTYIPTANVKLPDEVDWRTTGAVTDVKNQGACGSCWAFASTGALEGQYFRKNGTLASFSEQNLVDCATPHGTNGCRGGWMSYAFNYIKQNGGINSEEAYPYEGVDGTCRYNAKNEGTNISGYVQLSRSEEALKDAVCSVGPVAVAIDASGFSFYSGGVFYDELCSKTGVNHAVLVVGYGTDPSNGDYWLVKNSWGTGWGEKGYIRMARNKDNNCNIASYAIYPTV